MTRKLTALALVALLAAPSAAIELSLEENKAERGNIGFIDMQRLFQTFPETMRAKENFEELVRQAEEQLNLKKADLLRLRNEVSQLKIERDFLAKTPIQVGKKPAKTPEPSPESAQLENLLKAPPAPAPAPAKPAAPPAPLVPAQTPAPAPAPAPAAATPAQAPTPAAPEVVHGGAPGPNIPAPAAPAASTGRRDQEPETDLTRPSIENLPGFGGGAAPAAPSPADENAREAAQQARQAAQAQQQRPQPAPAPAPTPAPKQQEPLIINIPSVSTAPIVVNPPTSPAETAKTPPKKAAETAVAASSSTAKAEEENPALAELDGKLSAKEKELAAKELEFKEQQSATEKDLLDLESRKTEILLGKIHAAVQEVARSEGVSVVVDKSSILYGHDAVDLTDKVMKYLKGT